MEWIKERKEERKKKNNYHINILLKRKDFIRLYQKNGRTNIDKFQIIDPANNKGTCTNCLVMSESG